MGEVGIEQIGALEVGTREIGRPANNVCATGRLALYARSQVGP